MRVEVAFAVTEFFGGFFVMGVPQVLGHGQGAAVFHVFQCGIDGGIRAVALGRGRIVNGGMREDDACFGHADEFDRLLGGYGYAQGIAVGHADVFAGSDDDAPGDEADVLPGVEHFGQPVEGRIRI